MSEVDLRALASNCDAFKRRRGYFTRPLSRQEADFPIAFSILAYDNIPQVLKQFGGTINLSVDAGFLKWFSYRYT